MIKRKISKCTVAVFMTAMLFVLQVFPVSAVVEPIEEVDDDIVIEGEYVPGEIIVCMQTSVADEKKIIKLTDAGTDIISEDIMDVSDAAKKLSKVDTVTTESLHSEKTVLKHIKSDKLSTEELIKAYSGKPGVLFAEPNYTFSIEDNNDNEEKNDTVDVESVIVRGKSGISDMTSLQYAYGNGPGGIDVPDWNNADNENAADTIVALVDSGVDYNNPDLKDVMWDRGLEIEELKNMGGGKYGINTVDEDEYWGKMPTSRDDPMDHEGHGTHVAGIVASKWNDFGVSGVANGTKIMAVKGSVDEKGSLLLLACLRGFDYIIKAKRAGENVVAVNCSWNASFPVLSFTYTVAELGENGIIVCCSSGNSAENTDINSCSGSVMHDIPTELNVNSSDSEGKASDFSNYGIRSTHVFAPGDDILSTFIENSIIYDPQITRPVSSDFYDDFSADYGNFEYKINENIVESGGVEDGFYMLKGISTDKSDEMTDETLSEVKDSSLIHAAVLEMKAKKALPELGEDGSYYLVLNRYINEDGDYFLKVFVRTKEGKWERPGITYSINENEYENYNLGNAQSSNKFDLENLDIRFVLKYPEDAPDKLSELKIGKVWITDAAYPYIYLDGTSMAAPAVAGEVAILAKQFPEDSAAKRAARILGSVKFNEKYEDKCITGGLVNVRNSLKEEYTPVVNEIIVADENKLCINGYFFGSKENTDVKIRQKDKEWSVADGTLELLNVYSGEGDTIEVTTPEGILSREEVIVTVTDTAKKKDRQSFRRYLNIVDEDGILDAENFYTRIPISDEDKADLRNVNIHNAAFLNNGIYYIAKELSDEYVNFEYKRDMWILKRGSNEVIDTRNSIAEWNGLLVYEGDYGTLKFYDGSKITKSTSIVLEDSSGKAPDWALGKIDVNDEIHMYYDGKDMLLFRCRKEDQLYGTIVFRMTDILGGKASYLGSLNNYYDKYSVITHEEKEGQKNNIYIIGCGYDRGESKDFLMESFTVDGFAPKDLSDKAPADISFSMENFKKRYSGCGVKDGIFIVGPKVVDNYESEAVVTADTFFYSYAKPEEGFRPTKKRMADNNVYLPIAVAGNNKVYFYGVTRNEIIFCYEDAETLSYGKENKETYADPASPLHNTTADDVDSVNADNAKYVFILGDNCAMIAGTKADVTAAFSSAKGYDASAKHRYISSNKKTAKVSRKGIVRSKKSGEVDITCEQKVKGGSWQSIGGKVHIYIQMPQMVKKKEMNKSDKNQSAYQFLKKTTYSPTRWTSSNTKVATIDDKGIITILKAGNTNIIAEYGEGKNGAKKKYKTKLKIR